MSDCKSPSLNIDQEVCGNRVRKACRTEHEPVVAAKTNYGLTQHCTTTVLNQGAYSKNATSKLNCGGIQSVQLRLNGVMLQCSSIQFYPEASFVHWSNDALFNLPVTANQQIVRHPVDQGLVWSLHCGNG